MNLRRNFSGDSIEKEKKMILCEYSSPILTNEGYPDDNGYRVYKCKVVEGDTTCVKGDIIIINGNNIPAGQGLRYLVEGNWKKTEKYGSQFHVTAFEEIIPNTYNGIVGFLSSGRIEGITPSIAELIYCKFRNETIQILDEDVNRLCEVDGISTITCEKIIASYEKERIFKKILVKLKKYGITENLLKKVFKEHGKETEHVIIENPYILNEFGFSMKNIERMSSQMNLQENIIGKAEAVILNIIKSFEDENGNSCIPIEIFNANCKKNAYRYKLTNEVIRTAKEKLIKEGKIIIFGDCLFRKQMDFIESEIAKEFFRITNGYKYHSSIDIEAEIKESEKLLKCKLHSQQREAVKAALQNGLLIITGGPGTGKTTVIKVLRNIYERVLKKDMMFLAPTGRAAARMKESSGYSAFTIHKHLHIYDDNAEEKQGTCIMESCTVCDESSMLDMMVGKRLLQSIKTGSQLVILGDVEQLPSVGPGAMLRDMINSGFIPTVALTKVFRQSSTSNIYLNCRKIVKGNLSLEYGDDFVLLDAYTQEEAADLMADSFMREVATYGIDEVCCLCPFRKATPTGVSSMNKRIQSMYNPPGKNKPELIHFESQTVFRLGDRIMNLRNTNLASNGDLGTIVMVGKNCIVGKFGTVEITYDYNQLDDVMLAYCMTIHKSQGSEFKSVISTMLESHGDMLQMNLFNTAVSRAKAKFILVGNEIAINMAILNREGISRHTMLRERIENEFRKRGA